MQFFSKYYSLAVEDGVAPAFGVIWNKVLRHAKLRMRALACRFEANVLPYRDGILEDSDGEKRSLDDLLESLRHGKSRSSLFLPENRDTYVALLKEHYPLNVERTLQEAQSVLAHRFELLGSNFEFANHINWHLDPESGRSWPRDYFEFIDHWMWSDPDVGDNKLPWELNRHQYFFTLGKAYWLTADEKYADECAGQILSWIRDNPLGFGINWYSSLEIGIRLISWALAFQFFWNSPRFMSRAGKPFLLSLYRQAEFLHAHLSINKRVRNNHIIGEVAGLIVFGILYPEFKDSGKWLRDGLEILEDELELQTFPDGVNKEQATSYHRFVLDFLLLIIVLSRRSGLFVPPQLDTVAEKMLTYVMSISMPNGLTPMIGDSDDGRGYVFEERATFWDFRDLLAVGAVVYTRPDFKYVAQDFGEEAFWLLGPQGIKAFRQLESFAPAHKSSSFQQAGHYVIRDQWKADGDFAFFRCGPFGLGGAGHCSHAHCDLLSFLLLIHGRSILIDSGTFSYHGSLRDGFRLTSAHNTVVIDGREQAKPLPHFGWREAPQAECMSWDGMRVVGSMRTEFGVTHSREIHHPKEGVWNLFDEFRGDGEHSLSWFFHFSPELKLSLDGDLREVSVKLDNRTIVAVSVPEGVGVELGRGWCSNSYGHKDDHVVLKSVWEGKLPPGGIGFGWKFMNMEEVYKEIA